MNMAELRYVAYCQRGLLSNLLANKVVSFLLFMVFLGGGLFHGSDISDFSHGVVSFSSVYVALFLFVSGSYFLMIADILVLQDKCSDFGRSLTISGVSRSLNLLCTLFFSQLPVLILGCLVLAVASESLVFFIGGFVFCFGFNSCIILFLMRCRGLVRAGGGFFGFKQPKSIFLRMIFLHINLFFRRFRANFLRDVFIVVLIVCSYLGLGWAKDVEAINFAFFIFSCLLASLSRYIGFWSEMETLESKLYLGSLPSSVWWPGVFLVASQLLMIPFIVVYGILTGNLLRSCLLFVLSGLFLLVSRRGKRWGFYINLGVSVAVFLFVRYRI